MKNSLLTLLALLCMSTALEPYITTLGKKVVIK